MLGKVVPMVFFAWAPDNLVLALLEAVLEPVKAHVDCFGAALFDGSIEDPLGTLLSVQIGCGGLWVAQVDEGLADWAAFMKFAPTSASAAEATTGPMKAHIM